MPKDKLMYLGNRIRSERKNCGLTQQELADQCGLAIKTVVVKHFCNTYG